MCEMRIRVPEQWKGDFLAMIGAARIGEREVLQLGREMGWDQLDVFVNRWLDYSEQRMAEAIAQLPPGKRIATSTNDAIAGTPDEGIVIKAEVEVLADENRMVVDLRDNIDALPCGLNLSEACARTSALIGGV